MTEGAPGPWIGRSLRRREDPPLLTGEGRFASDIRGRDLVHVAIRRAGLPSGRIRSLDLGRALAMPGVLGAWSHGMLGLADDHMPDPPGPPLARRRPLLASEHVRYEGEAIAVVAATSEYAAHDAAEAIDVEIEPEPADRSPVTAQEFGFGDSAAGAAPIVVRERLRMGRVLGAAMEPRAAWAEWHDDQQRLEMQASVGWAHGLRDVLAACLGLRPDQVRAFVRDVGGSFGAKNNPYPEYVLVAAVSRLLQRPATWTATRSEDGHTTAQAHDVAIGATLGADREGRLLGFECDIEWPIGAYVTGGAMQDRNMAMHAMSAYRLPALRVTSAQNFANTPPAAHIRGGGRPVGNFAIERMLDRLARALDLDPVEVRRRNLLPPGAMPHPTGFQGLVYDGGDYPRLLQIACDRIGLEAVRARQRDGERIGLGIAMCVESTGFGRPEPTRIVVNGDGSVVAHIGSTPHGQGHATFAAQVVADRLGWPIDRVRVLAGDSGGVGFSNVTAGSRTALEVGNSLALSSASARRQLLERAGDVLEADAADVVFEHPRFHVRGAPARSVPLAEVIGGELEVTETWDSQGAPAFASSCHAALVGIDTDTGGVEMLRYVIAHDGGVAINPLLVDGQLHGGYAHGLGYALFEEAVYGEAGTFLSPTFLDYTVVSAPELRCEPELVHIVTASSQNPEGFRGAGEAGTIAVPAAIANAVEDALLAAGRAAVVREVPITPERLWRLLRDGETPAGSAPDPPG